MDLTGLPEEIKLRFTRDPQEFLAKAGRAANLIWDIETGPSPNMPPFDREGALAVLREKYKKEETILNHLAKDENDHIEKAALSPFRGMVLAIGVMASQSSPEAPPLILYNDNDESEIFSQFWDLFSETSGMWAGYNTGHFDFPFTCRRSWLNQVYIPPSAFSKRWYPSDRFVDLYKIWGLGEPFAEGGVNAVARGMGVGAKTGDGAMFHTLWSGGDVGRQAAEEYLMNDLLVERAIAEIITPHLY